MAAVAGVGVYNAKLGYRIDEGVYDKVWAFRAPNSRHAKTGLHKRWLSIPELMGLALERIQELAKQPEPFALPDVPATDERAVLDWRDAEQHVREADVVKQASAGPRTTLNRLTLDIIREGASDGDRHRLLYSAARDLGEFGCNVELAWALLGETFLDCGLSPKDVRRQIECGLKDGGKNAGA